ncbi:6-bladed beta-propeller [Prolixibacteraceae bacterium]|nr:6-bladed beta-propeller [Prolixibacteraceae bacterium]
MKIIILFLLPIFFISCTINDKATSVDKESIVKLELDLDMSGEIKLSTLFDSVQYIPLETTESSLIGDVRKVIIKDKMIFIQDYESNSLNIFNGDGKFISKLQKIGNGSDEYIRIRDFAYDKDKRHIYLNVGFEIKVYTISGEFIKKWKLPSPAREMEIIGDEIFFYCGTNSSFIDNGQYYGVVITDLNGNINSFSNTISSDLISNLKSYYLDYHPVSRNNRLMFLQEINDTIYSYKDNCFYANYFYKYKGVEDVRINNTNVLAMDIVKPHLMRIVQFDNILLSMIMNKDQYYLVKTDLRSKTSIAANLLKNELIDDVSNISPLPNFLGAYHDFVLGILPAHENVEIKKRLELQDDSNPIIIKYYFD